MINKNVFILGLLLFASSSSVQAESFLDKVMNYFKMPGSYSKYEGDGYNANLLKTSGNCPQHYPLGIHTSSDKDVSARSFYLCKDKFAIMYDPEVKNPVWVSQMLTKESVLTKNIEREENFRPDPELPPAAQASLDSFVRSGFDRGHMAPAADFRDDKKAMDESFYLSNISPQLGTNMNRGIWAELEKSVRQWAIVNGHVLVVSGPLFLENLGFIGSDKNKVYIPSHFFKIIISDNPSKSIGFVIPNKEVISQKSTTIVNSKNVFYCHKDNMKKRCALNDFIVGVAEVERLSQIDFNSSLKRVQRKEIEGASAIGQW